MIEVKYNKRKRPKCIDLFSGAGGLSLGFLMAGGEPMGAVDNDSDSIDTYRAMFPNARNVHYGDISTWGLNENLRDIDVIVGGPPCQGFSLARGLRFADDPRNHLYKEFVRVVDLIRPSWIVMENVQGITNLDGGAVLTQILEDFHAIGYELEYKVVNMAEYGVPQLRKRAIFVGNSVGEKFCWPEPLYKNKKSKIDMFSHLLPNFVSVNDALSDLKLPRGNYFSHRANSKMRGPRNRCAHSEPAFTLRVRGDEFALCNEPAQSSFIPGPCPDEPSSYSRVENEVQAYFRHQPPKWIKSADEKFTKGRAKMVDGTRKLTIREQARLQSFPDWFSFHGTRYSKSRQIGNAVPPLFAYHMFRSIFNYL